MALTTIFSELIKIQLIMKSYWYLFLVPVFMGLTACHDDNDEPKQRVSYLSCPDNHHPHMIDLGLPSGT
ncbi:MAG: hypothetical protein II400_01805, partial [Bacteroidaceae bacterium]|nr:hypothetical protein [Bacteroidaceae bacterium]